MRAIRHPSLADIELTEVMFALSDPARAEIVRKLAVGEALTCQALTGERAKSTMSRHFKVLRDSGLVRTEIDGKEHRNTLRFDELEERFPGVLPAVLEALRAR